MRRRDFLVGGALVGLTGCLDVRPSGGDSNPTEDSFYETGTIDVRVEGEAVDLTADRFQAEHADEDVRFHFHEGDKNWHMERERVTFARGIDLLPRFAYRREDGANVITIDGTTYDERDDGPDVAFRVDGAAVDPTTYELRGGDRLVVEVTTGG